MRRCNRSGTQYAFQGSGNSHPYDRLLCSLIDDDCIQIADLGNSEIGFFNGTRGADPARIAAQVVSGVSFLGAGVIFHNGSSIHGLTTAAGVWVTAGIGLSLGSGMYVIGIFSTAIVALIQYLMHRHSFSADVFNIGHVHCKVTQDFNFNFNKSIKDFIEITTFKLWIQKLHSMMIIRQRMILHCE